MNKLILPFILISALLLSTAGCDSPTQNFDFTTGDQLMIDGPTQITLQPDTTTADTTDRLAASANYAIVYATKEETYNWSVSNNAKIDSTYLYNAQKATVTFPSAGTYVISIDGSKYNGADTVTVSN